MIDSNITWPLAVLLALACPGISLAAASSSTEPIRILFIGNSYTYVNDLPRIVQVLAIQSGKRRLPQVRMVTGPGFTFEDHWKLGSAIKALDSNRWDYVVLQEQSQRPLRERPKMQDFGTRLIQAAQQRGAKTLLFVTWARADQQADQEPISASYAELAGNSAAQLVPVGPAWRQLLDTHPQLKLYSPDGSHPSPTGSYLAACIFYKTVYGTLPQAAASMTFESSQHSDYGYAQQTVPVPIDPAQLPSVRRACAGEPTAKTSTTAKTR
jgi:hypothetical protein